MAKTTRRSPKTSRTKTAAPRSPAERLEPARAPTRPRGLISHEPSNRTTGVVRFVSALFTLALVSMVIISGIGFAVYHQYESRGPLQETRTIVVPKGEGRIAIAERLEREGIITNRWTFVGGHVIQSLFGSGKPIELKAGEYELKAGSSMREVLDTLAAGRSILYKITIPEGLTSKQIVERLRVEPNLSGEIKSVPPEGALLPDTYLVSKGTRRDDIVGRMQSAMTKTLEQMWEARSPDLPLRSAAEVVTLASIIEKETGRNDERERVSAVFHNRLKKGMRLQSDPTIIYGLVGGEGTLGRSITKTDIATQTPYNTYRINGLPPGPIANPGKQSLSAAFNPAKTDDLYFVADGTGGHTFSSNLKDHNTAVKTWRDVERDREANRPAEAAAVPSAIVSDASIPVPTSTEAPPSSAINPLIVNAGPNPKVITAPPASPAATASVTDIPLPVRKPRAN